MKLQTALQGMYKHREALQDIGSASNPSLISEETHRLVQYLSLVEESLADLEAELKVNEASRFKQYIEDGNSANASKELLGRDFPEERAQIIKITRLVSSGWKLVNASQARVKHLIAEATNQI